MHKTVATNALSYRALSFSEIGSISLVEKIQRPLAAGQIRLRVLGTGICGSDIHGIAGSTGRREIGQVMGHETSGVVTEVADKEDAWLIGRFGVLNPVVSCGACPWCANGLAHVCQKVWIIGVDPSVDATFADEAIIPRPSFVPMNSLNDPTLGALAEPLAVGFHAASQADISLGASVLVVGGGPIGQACALGAKALGAESVTVVEPNPYRAEIVRRLGFAVVEPEMSDEDIAKVCGGTPNVVIDAVGSTETVSRALSLSRIHGAVVLVGMASPSVTIPSYLLSTRERVLRGSYCYSPESFTRAANWLGENELLASQIVDLRVSLEDAPLVIGQLVAGRTTINKAVIVPS